MRQLTASQKIAILENRIAHLEKQAMLSAIKEKIFNFFNWVKAKYEIAIYGADEESVKKQMKSLLEDSDFVEHLKSMPTRGGFSRAWAYVWIYLKKVGTSTHSSSLTGKGISGIMLNTLLGVALGYMVIFVGLGATTALFMVFAKLFIDVFQWGSESELMEKSRSRANKRYYEREIAKQRLIDEGYSEEF